MHAYMTIVETAKAERGGPYVATAALHPPTGSLFFFFIVPPSVRVPVSLSRRPACLFLYSYQSRKSTDARGEDAACDERPSANPTVRHDVRFRVDGGKIKSENVFFSNEATVLIFFLALFRPQRLFETRSAS